MDKPHLKAALSKISGGKTHFAGNDIYEALDAIFSSYKNKYIKIRDLFAELHEIGFGFVLFFAGLIGAFIPFLGGFLPVFFGYQMLMGRDQPWIPAFIADKKINIENFQKKFKSHKPKFDFVNRFLKLRYEYFSSKLGEKLIGAVVLFCGFSILIPLPATNLVPGLSIMAIAIGLLTKDGLVTTIAIALGILSALFGFGVASATIFAVSIGLGSMG